MDPWTCEKTEEAETINANLEEDSVGDTNENNTIKSTNSQGFSDNFHPSVVSNKTFEKLPDSQEYLASLEKKLSGIQSGKPDSTKELISSLEATRESYLAKLISNTVTTTTFEDDCSNEELKVNPILKKLIPEQAVGTEELVELVKADQLANNTEEALLTEEVEQIKIQDEDKEKSSSPET